MSGAFAQRTMPLTIDLAQQERRHEIWWALAEARKVRTSGRCEDAPPGAARVAGEQLGGEPSMSSAGSARRAA